MNRIDPVIFVAAVAIFCVLFFCVVLVFCHAEDWTPEEIADAIYLAEGGARAKVPYGILSVRVKDEAQARRVCLNTIRNQMRRHAEHRCGLTFLECLAQRYAPVDAHRLNRYWLKNVIFFLDKGRT